MRERFRRKAAPLAAAVVLLAAISLQAGPAVACCGLLGQIEPVNDATEAEGLAISEHGETVFESRDDVPGEMAATTPEPSESGAGGVGRSLWVGIVIGAVGAGGVGLFLTRGRRS